MATGRRRLANPRRFESNTLARCCKNAGSLLPFLVYDACWNVVCNDFGVFQLDPSVVTVHGFSRLLDTDFVSIELVAEAMADLEKEGQWISWLDRRTGQRWAIFPAWGDEQTIGNPAINRDPLPPTRTLKRCSLKTREFFAKYSRVLRESLPTDSRHTSSSSRGGEEVEEGGEGVQGERGDLPSEWSDLLKALYAVLGYPQDVAKDTDVLSRASGLYGRELVTRVVGAWATRRADDPLRPNSRPRVEIWNWCRKQQQWDEEARSSNDRTGKPSAAAGW